MIKIIFAIACVDQCASRVPKQFLDFQKVMVQASLVPLWQQNNPIQTGTNRNDQDQNLRMLAVTGMPQGLKNSFQIPNILIFRGLWCLSGGLWPQNNPIQTGKNMNDQDHNLRQLAVTGMPQVFQNSFQISNILILRGLWRLSGSLWPQNNPIQTGTNRNDQDQIL